MTKPARWVYADPIFENIKFHFCYFFLDFYVFQSKIISFVLSAWSLTHVFREYLRENEKDREAVFACSSEARLEFLKPKNGQKSRDTVPLSGFN